MFNRLAIVSLLCSLPISLMNAQGTRQRLPASCADDWRYAKSKRTVNADASVERADFVCRAMADIRKGIAQEARAMEQQGSFPMLVYARLLPFADWDYYYVSGNDLEWHPNPGQSLGSVRVPQGFVTDLASVPRVFWQVLPPQGRHAYAAVVHDYLYWTQDRPRTQADDILLFAMQDSKVDPNKIVNIFAAVHERGQAAWDRNSRLKKEGECRMLNLRLVAPSLADTWASWKLKPSRFTEANCRRI